ncbi:hypothetical protein [Clostridium disporicum]|uniref:hypothetical protein n=1 Tax=Clostridium disporicum TaxID=84024 RepID=UPI0034A44BDF
MNFDENIDYGEMLNDLFFGGDTALKHGYNSLSSLANTISDMEYNVSDMKESLEMIKKMFKEMSVDETENKNQSIYNKIRELNLSNKSDVMSLISNIIKKKDFELANLLKGKLDYAGYESISVSDMKFGIGDEYAIERSFEEVCSAFISLDLNNDEDCTKVLNFISFLPF